MSEPRKTVVVVGGAGAIGSSIAQVHAEQGDRVIVADLGDTQVVRDTLVGGGGHVAVRVDVTDLDSIMGLLGPEGSAGEYSAVVYAAGTNYTGPVATTDWSAYDRLMAVNLRGAFHVGQAMSLSLRESPRTASAVFLSSTAGLKGEGGGSVYCSTKFGLIGFVQSLAAEIAQFGGRANAVAPGNIDSPMLRQLAAQIGEREGLSAQDQLDAWAALSAFNRLIDIREVATACAFLTAAAASGISGQTLVVDGPPL